MRAKENKMRYQKRDITAIILAGGKSSRMGVDKGFMLYNNKPFISHIIKATQHIVNEIIIVSNNAKYDQFNLKRVNDILPDAGPLSGVCSGLFHSQSEHNLVLSCDLPLIKNELLRMLIDQVSDAYDIVQTSVQGRINPLLAMYKKQCASSCLAALKSGERQMCAFTSRQRVKTILIDVALEKYAANINTPHQFRELFNREVE